MKHPLPETHSHELRYQLWVLGLNIMLETEEPLLPHSHLVGAGSQRHHAVSSIAGLAPRFAPISFKYIISRGGSSCFSQVRACSQSNEAMCSRRLVENTFDGVHFSGWHRSGEQGSESGKFELSRSVNIVRCILISYDFIYGMHAAIPPS